MKKSFFIVAVTMLTFISCKNATTTDTGTTSNPQDKNLENNNMVYKAIETGDMKPVDSLFANDVVDHQGPGGKDISGKNNVMTMLGDIHNHVKDLKLDVITSAANGDYIFSLVHVTGTPSDSSMGMPGTKIDEREVDVVKLKDGKAAEHWGFADDAEVSKRMMEMQSKMSEMGKKK